MAAPAHLAAMDGGGVVRARPRWRTGRGRRRISVRCSMECPLGKQREPGRRRREARARRCSALASPPPSSAHSSTGTPRGRSRRRPRAPHATATATRARSSTSRKIVLNTSKGSRVAHLVNRQEKVLVEELKQREEEATQAQQEADVKLLDAKKLASEYQKEADKYSSGMDTCEEAGEKSVVALVQKKKLTSLWEQRAWELGWKPENSKAHT